MKNKQVKNKEQKNRKVEKKDSKKNTNSTKRIAVYPGSFDPITLGHVDIIQRIAKLYDEVIILVSQSADKKYLFSTEERKKMIQESLPDMPHVRVDAYEGLTIQYAEKVEAQVLVRGLRAVVDFEYELSMGNINKTINPNIETVLVFASPEYYFISSRMVKDIVKNNGPIEGLVPKPVIQPLRKKWGKK